MDHFFANVINNHYKSSLNYDCQIYVNIFSKNFKSDKRQYQVTIFN